MQRSMSCSHNGLAYACHIIACTWHNALVCAIHKYSVHWSIRQQSAFCTEEQHQHFASWSKSLATWGTQVHLHRYLSWWFFPKWCPSCRPSSESIVAFLAIVFCRLMVLPLIWRLIVSRVRQRFACPSCFSADLDLHPHSGNCCALMSWSADAASAWYSRLQRVAVQTLMGTCTRTLYPMSELQTPRCKACDPAVVHIRPCSTFKFCKSWLLLTPQCVEVIVHCQCCNLPCVLM